MRMTVTVTDSMMFRPGDAVTIEWMGHENKAYIHKVASTKIEIVSKMTLWMMLKGRFVEFRHNLRMKVREALDELDEIASAVLNGIC